MGVLGVQLYGQDDKLNLLVLVLLHSTSQLVTQPVASSVSKQSMWQVLAIANESMPHRGVGGASVPSGLGVGLSRCATATQTTPARIKRHSEIQA